MERDFMGLNSKDSVVVKEEFVEGGCEESGFARSSGISWPSSKVSALPQFMSLKNEQDEKPSKNGHLAHPIHDVKMYPFSMMSPFLRAHFMGTNQKFGGGPLKQQFHGANSHAAASVAGTTEQLSKSKASGVPAQLTIFYGGTVNVFDDISPEKAQAIMLLAGNAYMQSKPHMQAPASKHTAANQALANQSMNTPPCSGLPSPMSVSSHPIDRSGATNDDYKVSKTTGMSSTLADKAEPPRVTPSIRSVAASAIISSAVPQARKASLARFLEKRKERVMSGAPYKVSKKAADCGTPESNDICSSSSLSVAK